MQKQETDHSTEQDSNERILNRFQLNYVALKLDSRKCLEYFLSLHNFRDTV